MAIKYDVYFDRTKRKWWGKDIKGNVHWGDTPVIVGRAIEAANAMYAEEEQ